MAIHRVSGVLIAGILLVLYSPRARAQPPPASPEDAARTVLDEPDDTPAWMTPTPGGLTAARAARLAVETSPAVRGAEAGRSRARAQADLAASGFAPRVDITGSYTRINEVQLPPFEFAGMTFDNPFPQILDLWAVRGELVLPVSSYFFSVWPSYEGAEGFAEAAERQVEARAQQVAFEARDSFYRYVGALGSRWVAEQTVESLVATLADVEARRTAGAGTRADVAQVQAQLASARAGLVQAEGLVRVTERVLRRRLHLPRDESIEVGEDLFADTEGDPPSEQALIEQAMDGRPEVLALRTVIEARQSLVRAAVGTTLPQLALIGRLETSSPNQRIIPQTTDFFTTWAVGAALTWSPNDLAMGIHRIREAEAQVTEAREDLAQLADAVAIEAARALAAYEAAAESIAAAREAVQAAELALADRRALLRAGVATSTEVIQAQLEHTRARLSLIRAYVDLHVARADIERVAGRAVPGTEDRGT